MLGSKRRVVGSSLTTERYLRICVLFLCKNCVSLCTVHLYVADTLPCKSNLSLIMSHVLSLIFMNLLSYLLGTMLRMWLCRQCTWESSQAYLERSQSFVRMEWLRVKAPSIPTHERVVLQPSTIFFGFSNFPHKFCILLGLCFHDCLSLTSSKDNAKSSKKGTMREDWERQGRAHISLV